MSAKGKRVSLTWRRHYTPTGPRSHTVHGEIVEERQREDGSTLVRVAWDGGRDDGWYTFPGWPLDPEEPLEERLAALGFEPPGEDVYTVGDAIGLRRMPAKGTP